MFKDSRKSNRTCKDCTNKSTIFQLLTDDELELIEANRIEVHFKAGENIRKQGTYLSHVISLNSGMAKLYLEGLGNRNIILRIIKPTNFIGGPGMFVDNIHHYSVTALVDSCVCFIDVKILKEIIHTNVRFGDEFIRQISIDTLSTYNRLINLTQKQTNGRLADTLIYLSQEIFESNVFSTILSKIDLSELTGISKDNIGKALKKFENEGLIRSNGVKIEILQPELVEIISNKG